MLRRHADDVPARMVDAAAILFTVLLIVLEVRHYLTGDPYRSASPLAETALDVSLLLAVVIGLERLRLKNGSVIHDLGARLLAVLVFVMIVFNLGVSNNPLFTGEPVGGPVIKSGAARLWAPGGPCRHPRAAHSWHAASLVQQDHRRHRAWPRPRLSHA
jgi:uncharacterized membrane protein